MKIYISVGANHAHVWWDSLPITEQNMYLKAHPNSHLVVSHQHRKQILHQQRHHHGIIKNLARDIHHVYRNNRRELRQGFIGLNKFKNGTPMNETDKKGVKKIAKVVGGALLLSLAGIAMFTPLAGLGMQMAESFFQQHFQSGSSESSAAPESVENKMDADEANMHELSTQMYEWLKTQDVEKLAAKLKQVKCDDERS